MTLHVLRADALRRTADGVELLLALPWIRSLPLAGVEGLSVTIDGVGCGDLRVRTDDRLIGADDLSHEDGWWFVQDRLVVLCPGVTPSGRHEVGVGFRLAIPYLPGGPDQPLTLPFHAVRTLTADAPPGPGLAPRETIATAPLAALPEGWTLAASAFNWTPEVIRAERPAAEIAVDAAATTTPVIELEAGQAWPSFPVPRDGDVDALRERLETVGGAVSIVGASIDDWTPDGRRRDDAERLAFLLPQLRAAARLGAHGIRLPLGQAGRALLERLLPTLHDLGLVLFEEAQGNQTPDADPEPFATIADLDDPHARLLLDISMLMPALPVSYLERLHRADLDADLLRRLEDDWREPATHAAVLDALRTGVVPASVHTLFMDLVVRFGRSRAADLRDVLPLVSGVHLKFWDLDDADGRVSGPIRDIGRELRAAGFTGTLCSEWGGHEWLDDDPTAMTNAHLALASTALAAE